MSNVKAKEPALGGGWGKGREGCCSIDCSGTDLMLPSRREEEEEEEEQEEEEEEEEAR